MLHRMGVERCCCGSTPVSGSIAAFSCADIAFGTSPSFGGTLSIAAGSAKLIRATAGFTDVHGGAILVKGGALTASPPTFTSATLTFKVGGTALSPDQTFTVFCYPNGIASLPGSWVTGPSWVVPASDDWSIGGNKLTVDFATELNAVCADASYNPFSGVGIGLYPASQSPNSHSYYRTMLSPLSGFSAQLNYEY